MQPSVRDGAGVIPIFREPKHRQLRSSGDSRLSKRSQDLALPPASQSGDAAVPLESQPPGRTRRRSKHSLKQLRSIASLASKIISPFLQTQRRDQSSAAWAAALEIVRKVRKLQWPTWLRIVPRLSLARGWRPWACPAAPLHRRHPSWPEVERKQSAFQIGASGAAAGHH